MSTDARPWPTELTRLTAKQVQRYRKQRRMTADQLAAAVTDLGLRYSRSQVTNLEAGRRDSVTVGEVFVLAAALGIPPLLLVFPLGKVETVEALPGVEVSPWNALRWAERGLIDRGDHGPEVTYEDYRTIEWFRRHEQLIGTWVQAQNDALLDEVDEATAERLQKQAVDGLASVRDLLRTNGLTPPPLPERLRYLDEGVPIGENAP